jgi:hypothetical protein
MRNKFHAIFADGKFAGKFIETQTVDDWAHKHKQGENYSIM